MNKKYFVFLAIFVSLLLIMASNGLLQAHPEDSGSIDDLKIKIDRLQKQMIAMQQQMRVSPPVGTVVLLATDKTPEGYLPCDGRALKIDEYEELYETIGTVWGAGDEIATFKVPDLRGQFIRILDQGKGIDINRELGIAQNYSTAMPKQKFLTKEAGKYQHSISNEYHSHSTKKPYLRASDGDRHGRMTAQGGYGAFDKKLQWDNTVDKHNIDVLPHHTHEIQGGDSETRPQNQALVAFIKY